MKQFSLTKAIGKLLVVPVLAVIAVGISSCEKEPMGKAAPAPGNSTEMTGKMRASVVKVLRDFAASSAGGSSSTSTSGGGSSTYSDPTMTYTTYSTPSANVYVWSDPTTGTTFTFSESTGGSGLGQLAYAGKSFDYNYVLSIKASDSDPTWNGFFDGRDLRGVVAIDGELTDDDFELNNLAMFFVATTGGSGTYEFIDFGASTVGTADGLGQIIDLSDAPAGTTLSGLGSAGTIYVTSGGHVNVSDSEFSMASDAKIMKLTTSVEYSLEGSIMFE